MTFKTIYIGFRMLNSYNISNQMYRGILGILQTRL